MYSAKIILLSERVKIGSLHRCARRHNLWLRYSTLVAYHNSEKRFPLDMKHQARPHPSLCPLLKVEFVIYKPNNFISDIHNSTVIAYSYNCSKLCFCSIL